MSYIAPVKDMLFCMKELAGQKPDEKQLSRIEAIINSMTPDERKHADIIDGSRRKRVAKGSGHNELDRAHATIVSRRVVKKSAPPPVVRGSRTGSVLPVLPLPNRGMKEKKEMV